MNGRKCPSCGLATGNGCWQADRKGAKKIEEDQVKVIGENYHMNTCRINS